MVPKDSIPFEVENCMGVIDHHLGHIGQPFRTGQVRSESPSNGRRYTFLRTMEGMEDFQAVTKRVVVQFEKEKPPRGFVGTIRQLLRVQQLSATWVVYGSLAFCPSGGAARALPSYNAAGQYISPPWLHR